MLPQMWLNLRCIRDIRYWLMSHKKQYNVASIMKDHEFPAWMYLHCGMSFELKITIIHKKINKKIDSNGKHSANILNFLYIMTTLTIQKNFNKLNL